MGYTHYWYIRQPAPSRIPEACLVNIRKEIAGAFDAGIIKHASIYDQRRTGDGPFAFDWIETRIPGPPEVTNQKIVFEGDRGGSCETFSFRLDTKVESFMKPDPDGTQWAFDFTKTRRLPYDFTVMTVLCLLKHGLGDSLRVSTDGNLSDRAREPVQVHQHVEVPPMERETLGGAIASIFNEWSEYGDEWNVAADHLERQYNLTISFDEHDYLQVR
jgi:hypothetical protein